LSVETATLAGVSIDVTARALSALCIFFQGCCKTTSETWNGLGVPC
jgi:hypothetical protein